MSAAWQPVPTILRVDPSANAVDVPSPTFPGRQCAIDTLGDRGKGPGGSRHASTARAVDVPSPAFPGRQCAIDTLGGCGKGAAYGSREGF
jgi:hypothetical protein